MYSFVQNEYGIGVPDRVIPLADYRLILCDIMQKAVYQTMKDMAPYRSDNDPCFFEKTMVADLERTLACTKLLSREASINETLHGAGKKLQSQRKSRPALF